MVARLLERGLVSLDRLVVAPLEIVYVGEVRVDDRGEWVFGTRYSTFGTRTGGFGGGIGVTCGGIGVNGRLTA